MSGVGSRPQPTLYGGSIPTTTYANSRASFSSNPRVYNAGEEGQTNTEATRSLAGRVLSGIANFISGTLKGAVGLAVIVASAVLIAAIASTGAGAFVLIGLMMTETGGEALASPFVLGAGIVGAGWDDYKKIGQ